AGAAEIVNPDELGDSLLKLAQDHKRCRKMGDAGKAVVEANRGAVSKTVKLIHRFL
ncbi:MAG: 3-deoxy-D-manno-octulosonic acid transferase, partial [Gammaproteobacteria bacterium]|nr:3-deoxy-D-manno-octulosonic acid transferase [Gammaproteobacteria bacterium]